MLSKLGLPNISKSSVIDSLICRLKMFSKSTSLIVLYAGHLKKKLWFMNQRSTSRPSTSKCYIAFILDILARALYIMLHKKLDRGISVMLYSVNCFHGVYLQ